jgi:DNA modification methylase
MTRGHTYKDQVICGSCSEIMAEMQAGSVDLTVTSPPYDKLRTYKGYRFDFESIAKQLYRVTKSGGVVVWVIGDETVKCSESGSSFRQVIYFQDLGFNIFDTMIYEKTGTNFPSMGRYTQIFEYMFVLSKGKPNTFNPICDIPKLWAGSWGTTTRRNREGVLRASNSETCGAAKSGRHADGRHGYKKRTNIWRITNGKKFGHTDELAYEHPATFPEKLAEGHILSWSNPGDLVFDPMCGAGTTLKVAKKNGRKYLGIDTSEEYCRLAERRLSL